MKKIQKISSLFMGVLTLGLASCGGGQSQQAPEAEYAMLTIKPTDKEVSTSYSATIRGRQDVDVMPQVAGTITKICVVEGQKVHRGQSLFIIDQVPYRAALNTAMANLDAAKAGVSTAQLSYDSRKQLFDKKVVSEFDLKTTYNSLLTAKAQLAQAQAAVVNAKNNLSYTEVKSPLDGVVGTLPYRVGALVSSAIQTPLTTVSDNSQMYVYFSMNESQILSLTRQYGSREKAVADMPAVQLQLKDNSIYGENGKVETISGVIDRSTGTASLRAVFPNKDGLLYSGTSGNVVMPSSRKACVVIPKAVTYEIQDKVFVFKFSDGKALSTEVKVTSANGAQEYIVEDGLKEGDVIIAEGVGILRDGTPVKAKSTSNETAKAAN